MTFSSIVEKLSRKQAQVERTIEAGAFLMLRDGRMGILVSIDVIQGEKRGYMYIYGSGSSASVLENEIFVYKNVVS